MSRHRTVLGMAYDQQRAERRDAAKTRAKPNMVISEEPCFYCGETSEFSHPGGVLHRRWKCYRCSAWQPDADPRPAKVLTEEEALARRDPFTRRIAEALERPALLDLERAQ